MNNISAVIVVKDNPQHFSETLHSLDFADEIIVVDIGMTPACRKIADRFRNVTIKIVDEEVLYVEQIREKTKSYASYDCIIFLDPDEVITPGLQEELIKNISKYDYISIPRKNIIFDKWIQHSRWWPDYQIRMFKKNAVKWPSRLHAQPEVTGKGLKLEAREDIALLHYNYVTISEYVSKMVRYAKAEANENLTNETNMTLPQAMKKGVQEFISRYFAEKGYQDGMHGTILAFLQMFYCLLVYFFYWEQKKDSVPVDQNQAIEVAGHFKDTLYEVTHWIDKEKIGSPRDRIKNKVLNSLLKRM